MTPELVNLPEDSEALKALVHSLILERDRETQRAEQLRIEMLRLQLELERFRKWYYGPRADRLQSAGEVAQMLLEFAGEVDRKTSRTVLGPSLHSTARISSSALVGRRGKRTAYYK